MIRGATTGSADSGEENIDSAVFSTNNRGGGGGGAWFSVDGPSQEQPTNAADVSPGTDNTQKLNVRQAVQRWQTHRQMFREDHPRTYEVFQQSLWYLGVFYVTHVWSTSNRTIQLINDGNTYYALVVFHSFFDPLQGFLNYLVYQRPRYLRIRAASPDMSALRAMVKALTFSRFGGAELSTRSLSRVSMLRSRSTQSLKKGSSGGVLSSEKSGENVGGLSWGPTEDVSPERSLQVIVEEKANGVNDPRPNPKQGTSEATRMN